MDLSMIVSYVSSDAGQAVIFEIAFAVMFLAQLIVNLTPTPADDAFVGKAYGWLEKVAGIWGYKAKMLPGEHLLVEEKKAE